MCEAILTRITRLEDPDLRAFSERVTVALLAAGHKAAAHLAASDRVALAAGDTLERAWLDYLRGQPIRSQSEVGIKSLALVTTRKVPGLEGLDLQAPRSTLDVVLDGVTPALHGERPGGRAPRELVRTSVSRGNEHARGGDVLELLLLRIARDDAAERAAKVAWDGPVLTGVTVDAHGVATRLPRVKLGDDVGPGVTTYDPPRSLARLDLRSPGSRAWKVVLADRARGGLSPLLDRLLDEACERTAAGLRGAGVAPGEPLHDAIAGALDHTLDALFTALGAWLGLDMGTLPTLVVSGRRDAFECSLDAQGDRRGVTLTFRVRHAA